jgi:FG-GAP-like repeat
MKLLHLVRICVLLLGALALAQSPIPLINQPLVPASVAPGSAAFTLTVNGTGFTSNAVVYWNGSLRPTTVVSSSTVQAQITAADVAKASVAWVTVGNLGAGAVVSNVVYFPVRTSVKGVGFLPRSIQNVTNSGTVVVGDFNNDGLLDFAIGGVKTIQVFLGKGNGTFQPPIATNSRGMVYGMAVGDFNGDGNLDMAAVTANPHCCRLNVFLGKGNGTFTRIKDLPVGPDIGTVLTSADFNGDGKLDLYFSSGIASATLLGLGDGTFSIGPGGATMLPRGTGYPAIADFNGDGNLDFAVAGVDYHGQHVVDVFLGKGDGSFAAKLVYPVSSAGDSVAAADVNGDGKVDLVTDGVSVLLGNGDGTFRKGWDAMLGFEGSVNIGDFNGDGKLDIAAGSSILLGNGKGDFQKPLTFAGLFSRSPISIGGFNADGGLDVLGVDVLSGALTLAVQVPVYFTPTNLDFGSQLIGTTSPPQPAALTSFGTKPLAVTIDITGANAADFAQTNNCGKSLPPNGGCKIQTTFTPSLVGNESASLNVSYTGSAPLSMPLSGTGTNQTFTVTLAHSTHLLTFGVGNFMLQLRSHTGAQKGFRYPPSLPRSVVLDWLRSGAGHRR